MLMLYYVLLSKIHSDVTYSYVEIDPGFKISGFYLDIEILTHCPSLKYIIQFDFINV